MDLNRQDTPTISVVIPCLDHSRELALCLQGLEAQAGDVSFEVLVVDGAWDERVAEAAARFPRVRLVRAREGLTSGAARNLGVQNSAADWIAFLDADCIPGSAWVKQACGSLRDGYYMCGGPVLDLIPNHPIAWADNHLQFSDFQAGRRAGRCLYMPACNMVMPRRIFDELGGFQESFFSAEDTLLTSLASSSFPEKMLFNPALIVRHHGRAEWRAFLEHQRLLGGRRSQSRSHWTPSYEWMARRPALAGLVMLRRFGYIGLRTLQYDPASLIRLALFFPWFVAGLAAWTRGFYAGFSRK